MILTLRNSYIDKFNKYRKSLWMIRRAIIIINIFIHYILQILINNNNLFCDIKLQKKKKYFYFKI